MTLTLEEIDEWSKRDPMDISIAKWQEICAAARAWVLHEQKELAAWVAQGVADGLLTPLVDRLDDIQYEARAALAKDKP